MLSLAQKKKKSRRNRFRGFKAKKINEISKSKHKQAHKHPTLSASYFQKQTLSEELESVTKFLCVATSNIRFCGHLPTEWTTTVSRCSRNHSSLPFDERQCLVLLCLFSATGFVTGCFFLEVAQCLASRALRPEVFYFKRWLLSRLQNHSSVSTPTVYVNLHSCLT